MTGYGLTVTSNHMEFLIVYSPGSESAVKTQPPPHVLVLTGGASAMENLLATISGQRRRKELNQGLFLN